MFHRRLDQLLQRRHVHVRLDAVSGVTEDERLARFVRDGIVRPARGSAAKELFGSRPPRPKKGASGVRALLEDRREAR